MYAATTKDEGNAADGRFSTACKDLIPFLLRKDGIYRKSAGNKEKLPGE